ncbi:protein of unknown function [Candidatus Methylocalor cossyra]|uniref:Uncharacterized protein n=1 Tax=Candidatus Methylocalor cossyra TaxID=3108543 RepID=A0ABM9NEI1_9GAMM
MVWGFGQAAGGDCHRALEEIPRNHSQRSGPGPNGEWGSLSRTAGEPWACARRPTTGGW